MAADEGQRKIAAILAADVAGYSRLMADDERATVRTLTEYREIFAKHIQAHQGRVVDTAGDSVLATFESVVEAVEASVEIQRELAGRNEPLPDHRRMFFRIGINFGDIIVRDDGTLYGDGVNVAARLEGLAEAGGVMVSDDAYRYARGKVAVGFADAGTHEVKNIAEPVRAFRVLAEGEVATAPPRRIPLRLAAAALLVIVVAGVAAWQATRPPEVEIAPALDVHRLAVLPFANLGAEAESEYFSDGMTEELIAKLSQLRSLTVIARTSVMQYKGTVKGIAEIGRELSVGTILEGSVRRAGDQLRITAQLIDVASEGHLWTETYDRPYADVFAVQSDVAQQVASALQVALQVGEAEHLASHGTDDLEAYDLYLQGLYHLNQLTGEGLEAGRALFARALDRDPSFAQAYAGLAQAYDFLGNFGHLPVKQAFPQAQAAAEAALALDDSIAEAHTELALMKTFLRFDWQAAELGYRRALEVNPNSAYAHTSYGILYLTPHGKHDEAIAASRRAIDIDPLSVISHQDLAWEFFHARRWEEALPQFRKVIEMEPEFANAHRGVGLTHAVMERFEPAIEALRKAVEYSGRSAVQLGSLGWAYGIASRHDEAHDVLERLRALAEQELADPIEIAMVHVGLGDTEAALALLEEASAGGAGSWRLIFLDVFVVWDPLRSEPRFAALVDKVGLGD